MSVREKFEAWAKGRGWTTDSIPGAYLSGPDYCNARTHDAWIGYQAATTATEAEIAELRRERDEARADVLNLTMRNDGLVHMLKTPQPTPTDLARDRVVEAAVAERACRKVGVGGNRWLDAKTKLDEATDTYHALHAARTAQADPLVDTIAKNQARVQAWAKDMRDEAARFVERIETMASAYETLAQRKEQQ